MLAALERGNLFLVPLDDRRRWYRYHHLFADVLQARLLDERPGQLPDLHRRASVWYQQNGESPVAIGHALAARDFDLAADLIERAIPAMRITRQEATVHSWLKALPDEVVRVRPMLSFAVAGALLTGGEPEEVEVRLRDAERWLTEPAATGKGSPARPAEMVVADEEEFRRLPGAIELYRSALARVRGDVPGTVRHARRTLDLALAEDHGVRAGAAGIWRQRTRRGPNARRDYGGPGRLPISSAAQSRWRTSGWRKAASARRCVPMSRPCSVHLSRTGRFCGERQTCTWG